MQQHLEVSPLAGEQPIVQVDAFTDRPFAGNPAAVCVLAAPRESAWMQAVAREMNLSETAFLVERPDGYGLRWFTPETEVDLCGHATLASAHVLWEEGCLSTTEPARFHTRSGLLTARRLDDWIELDFPARQIEAIQPPPALNEALGIEPTFVGREKDDYLVEVAGADTVRRLTPDFGRLRTLPVRGVAVTAAGDGEHDFVSRFFAPRVGVPEDPVTGSAHCYLGPYWQAKLGKDELIAYQASARGGLIWVRPRGERIGLAGRAVTVLRGHLTVGSSR